MKQFLAGCLLIVFLLSLIPAIPVDAAASSAYAEPSDRGITVMSYNILDDCTANSNGVFPYDPPAQREDASAAMLRAYRPDIIGMQEAGDGGASGLLDWCSALDEDLSDIYAYRSLKDETGYSLTITRGLIIFYNKTRFTLLESGGKGYDEPENNKRAYHWVKLLDNETNIEFFVFNTHWHVNGNQTLEENKRIRTLEMQELADAVARIAKDHHVFMTGDYNTSYAPKNSMGDHVNIARFLEVTGYKDALVSANELYTIDGNGTRTTLQADDAGLSTCVDHVVYPSELLTADKMERILTRTYSTKLSDHDAILVHFTYRRPALSASAAEGKLDVYFSNGAYYIDNLSKRTKDLPIEVHLPEGAIYKDQACTKPAGTTLTIRCAVSKTYMPENTYYIQFGGEVYPLYLRSCNSNTTSNAMFVDKSFADKAVGSTGLYCDKWYCRLVTVGVNGFATIQEAVDAAQDGYRVSVAPGTYYENVTYSGKSLDFYGSNRNNLKALILKDGQLTVNTARTYETYLSGNIAFDMGDLQAASIMVNGFHFIDSTAKGQILITGGNVNKTVSMRICNNLFNCYTDGSTSNGSAIHGNSSVRKIGVIEDNYFHLTKIPSFTNESGNIINYTNRAITMRNMKNMTIHANYFDGYTGSMVRPFWLSSETSSGSTAPGFGNLALTNNRFENCSLSSIYINNIRGATNADVLIAGNSYGGHKPTINFSDTSQQISKNLLSDKSKITFAVQTEDYPNLTILPTNNSGVTAQEFTHYVTFRSDDKTFIYGHSVVNDTTAVYNGTVPTKEATEAKHYIFKEWVDANGTAVDLSQISATTEVYASFTETAHTTEVQNQTAPTCTETGYSGDKVCTVCGYQVTAGTEIPATGHTPVTDKAVAATCTTVGKTEGSHCSVCKAVIKAQTTVPALGHENKYTDNGDGTHTGTCARCKDVCTEGHKFTGETCFCGGKVLTLDESIKIYHTLDLASDISITFAVPMSTLTTYDSYYLEVVLPEYEGNVLTGTSTVQIQPVVNGNYYYFTLTGITAVRMGDMVDATLHMTRGTAQYISVVDTYSVATYAYSMLSSTTDAKMLTLCADLLRYGAEAQRFKGYRTNALVDAEMTKKQMTYLSNTENLTFTATDSYLNDLANPVLSWVGKTLDLGSKVGMKFVFNAKNYSGDIENLSMKVSYQGSNGEAKTVTLTGAEVYNAKNGYYSFTFYGLLASELRTIIDVAVFDGNTQLTETLRYSAESYASKNTTGALGNLCKALFAYSDSARAYFA